MTLGNSVRNGTQWLITKNVGIQVSQFIFGIALARLLIPEDFGLVTTVQIFTGVVGMVAGGGVAMALVQSKELGLRDYDVMFTVQLIIGILIFTGFYLFAPWFALAFDNPGYVELMRVAAIDFLWRPFYSTLHASLQREMRFKAQAGMLFFSMALSGIIAVSLAWQDYGVWSLILSPLISKLITIPLLMILARQPLKLHLNRAVIQKLGGYGMRMSVNNLVVYVNRQIDNIIISRLLGPATLGLYNKAVSLHFTPIDIIGQPAYQTAFRALSTQQDDLPSSRYLYFRTITLVSVYTLPLYVGLWWLAAPFIEVVYGAHWLGAAEPLRILVLAGIFHCVAWPSRAVIAAQDRLGAEMRIQIVYGILLTAGCLITVRWGLNGIAGTVITLRAYQTWRLFRLANTTLAGRGTQLLAALRPALLLNAILFGTLWAAHVGFNSLNANLHPAWYLLGMCLAGGTVYAACFLFLPIKVLASEAQRWKQTLAFWRRAG